MIRRILRALQARRAPIRTPPPRTLGQELERVRKAPALLGRAPTFIILDDVAADDGLTDDERRRLIEAWSRQVM